MPKTSLPAAFVFRALIVVILLVGALTGGVVFRSSPGVDKDGSPVGVTASQIEAQ